VAPVPGAGQVGIAATTPRERAFDAMDSSAVHAAADAFQREHNWIRAGPATDLND